MQDVSNCTCEGIENDWLNVTYTERKYIHNEDKLKTSQRSAAVFIKRNAKYVVAVVLLIAAVAGMAFVSVEDGIFQTARLAYTSTLFDNLTVFTAKQANTVTLPPIAVVDSVAPDGTVVLTGGKVATCLEKGTVTEVTDTTVTVQVNDELSMVYSQLTEILVQQGQVLEQYSCIGKYQGTTAVNLVYNGSTVTEVIGSLYSFSWES